MLIAVTVIATNIRAQTFDEWVKQQETKLKYMLQQIAANKVYIEYLQKGYNVARNGLQTINDIKHGDFNLHSEFFNSLSAVNPGIKNLAKVVDIILFQIQIIKESKSAIQTVQSSNQLTPSEINYLQNVFDHLLGEFTKNINDLIAVITSGETIMSDDERVKRIDDIYCEMQSKLSFSKSFSADARMLALQRLSEQTDIEVNRKLNGIQ
jgi:hypothetical protein